MNDNQKQRIKDLGLSEDEFEPKKVSQLDEIEAQVLYTAMMTDTLIEE